MKLVNFFRSGKNLFGQVNSQTLSDQLSCKVSATFVNTANVYKRLVAELRIEPATSECQLDGAPDRSQKLFPEPRPELGNVVLYGHGC